MTQLPFVPAPVGPNKKFTFLQILQIIVLISAILYFGRALFIPLSFSLLISFILYPICAWLEKKGLTRSLAIGLAMSLLSLIAGGLMFLLYIQLKNFKVEWFALKQKISESLESLSVYLSDNFNISLQQQNVWIEDLTSKSVNNFIPFFQEKLYTLSIALVLLILIPVMSSLILYHRQMFLRVLYSFFAESKKIMIRKVLHETVHAFYSFIKGMILVYLIVGILNSTGLAILGIPHPILFGFIASVLTFIPYVGIIIASILPISIAWTTYNSIWYPVGVILIFTFVQYLEANVIFPFTVSNRLQVNTLATILAILAGGILWGASGMILFIPFLGILKLIADKVEGMEAISDLLGTQSRK
ncbi:MAG: AI-2E family transporter [Bacteroidia bacterium]|nr:AI-2E family transporter [Bacteroidia bacterium]